MMRMQMILASGVAAATLLTGRSTAMMDSVVDTTCKDFTAADEKRQNETITKMSTDEGRARRRTWNLPEPDRRADLCQPVGTPDSKISHAPHM